MRCTAPCSLTDVQLPREVYWGRHADMSTCSAHCRGCVTPQTVSWLNARLARMPRAPTSAAFIHIPVPEFVRAWNRGVHVSGEKRELTCCPSCNSGALQTLRCARAAPAFTLVIACSLMCQSVNHIVPGAPEEDVVDQRHVTPLKYTRATHLKTGGVMQAAAQATMVTRERVQAGRSDCRVLRARP